MRLDKLTTTFQQAIGGAQSLAVGNDNPSIEVSHVVLSLLEDHSGGSRSLIARSGGNTNNLLESLKKIISNLPKLTNPTGEVGFSSELGRVLNLTDKESQNRKDDFVASELFFLVLSNDKCSIGKLMRQNGITSKNLEATILAMRGGSSVDSSDAENKREALKKYTVDLTEKASKGILDPVIGRDDEIRRCIQILQRRTKNNPVLIGEPGVGKTAIAEGLAQRINNNEVPEGLKKKKLLSLDLSALLAGAKFRGEFEERLKSVLKDLSQIAENEGGHPIVFIDEIHTMVGAGKAEGAMDAGNMLKPALSRGELHCIGATTLDEYRKYIEKDAALERRFQKVLVGEPSVESTIGILRGLQERYELHHGVDITDPAIVSAAELSNRYITDRFLPDKAIDLIDEAASRVKMEIDSKPEAIDKIDRRMIQLKIEKEAVKKEKDDASQKRLKLIDDEIKNLSSELSGLEEIWRLEKLEVQGAQNAKEEIEKIKKEIEVHTRKGDWQKVSELQYGTLPDLEKGLKDIDGSTKTSGSDQPRLLRTQVGSEEIAEVVSRATGIPVSKMMQGEREKLLDMESVLHQRVIGQNEAVSLVSDAIRRSRSGLSDPQKPYGSFLFLGPTGVGKTELCKTLAQFLFDSEEHLVRLDMSEFMEKHSVSRLVGAPPGYVGYEEGGALTEVVRRNPYSVILLDEVEKAHPDVFNILLQVLDDGRLTDGQGRTVDFRNTVIVMTSNLGSQEIQKLDGLISDQIKETVMFEVNQHFRPEFINRIDEIVVFHALKQNHIKDIAGVQIKILASRLASQEIKLEVSDAAINQLVKIGFDSVYGARPLKRAMQSRLENKLAKLILEGKVLPNATVSIDFDISSEEFSFNGKVN